MPGSKRRSDRKSEKERQQERRDLIAKCNIHFDGPIPPSKWPLKYAKIFQNIRTIGHELFDEYKATENRSINDVIQLKKRVYKLNGIAYNCRKERLNEASWRASTETEVTHRFGAEVVCQSCSKRIWIAEVQALQYGRVEVERVAKGTRCTCEADLRAKEDLRTNEPGEALMFSRRASTAVEYDPNDQFTERPREPDLVLGLRMTKSLEICTSARPDLRHSPYTDRWSVYPFLILEAKSEKGSQGFESIEAQTALPIRALLRLQQNLQQTCDRKFDPLVWFLACQGDEWRVYASVVEDSNFRIIDLWHGTILSQDGALQLLRIMDFLCGWARHVYRRRVISCLATETVDPRELTPAESDFSSQRESSDNAASPPSPSSPKSWDLPMSQTPPLIDLTEEDELMEDIPLQQSATLEKMTLSDSHYLLRFSGLHQRSNYWKRKATIRHANLVLFSFQQFALPEDRLSLETSLKMLGSLVWPFTDAKAAAVYLLQVLVNDSVTITTDGLTQLEKLWTGADHIDYYDPDTDKPVRACIIFATDLRSDWQVIRQLLCITCSEDALTELAKVACESSELESLKDWTTHRCACLLRSAQILKSLCDKDSATAAWGKLSFYLKLDTISTGEPHLSWNDFSKVCQEESAPRGFMARVVAYVINNDFPNGGSRKLIEVLPGKPAPPHLRKFFGVPKHIGRHGAILLTKPNSWPQNSPKLCLMVFEEVDFEDDIKLGSLITCVAESGDIYGDRVLTNIQEGRAESLRASLNTWTDFLTGKISADTPRSS